MDIDYTKIGKRISQRRRELHLKQAEVEEKAEIGYKYLSNIERGISIPSVEVIMRLAKAMDTTPDTFLVGAFKEQNDDWKSVSVILKSLNKEQLSMAKCFLLWLSEQNQTP